jgi:hypothetical protein
VGLGAANASFLLCRVSDRCGSIEPSRTDVPPAEGQRISWSETPDQKTIAAISESRRIHFFANVPTEHAPFAVNVVNDGSVIPTVTNEYIVVSGATGRRVATVFSDDGQWVAAFEIDQFGYNKNLVLVNLMSHYQIRLDEGIGCKYFSGVTFDPFGKAIMTWYNAAAASDNCASIVDLSDEELFGSQQPRVTHLAGYERGALTLSNRSAAGQQ